MSTTKALAVIAISHRQAPLAVLEQVNLDADGCAALARTLSELDGVSEAVVLSTCNRTELYLAGYNLDLDAALGALVGQTSSDLIRAGTHVWHGFGSDAARHLFSVAAGLESRVAGEREIVGQVRSAIATAREAGTVGSHLDCVFRSAIAVGRRVHQNDCHVAGTATATRPRRGSPRRDPARRLDARSGRRSHRCRDGRRTRQPTAEVRRVCPPDGARRIAGPPT